MNDRKIESVHVLDCRGTDKRPIVYKVQVYVSGRKFPFYIRLVKCLRRSCIGLPDAYDYILTSDPLYAFPFSKKAAERHADHLMKRGVL